ncbi:hypothetical protein [Bradyrhizobium sp. USDA 4353]
MTNYLTKIGEVDTRAKRGRQAICHRRPGFRQDDGDKHGQAQ